MQSITLSEIKRQVDEGQVLIEHVHLPRYSNPNDRVAKIWFRFDTKYRLTHWNWIQVWLNEPKLGYLTNQSLQYYLTKDMQYKDLYKSANREYCNAYNAGDPYVKVEGFVDMHNVVSRDNMLFPNFKHGYYHVHSDYEPMRF